MSILIWIQVFVSVSNMLAALITVTIVCYSATCYKLEESGTITRKQIKFGFGSGVYRILTQQLVAITAGSSQRISKLVLDAKKV